MSTETNEVIARRFAEEVTNQKRLDVADEIIAADHVFYMPGIPPVRGLEAWKQLASIYFTAFPDFQVTVEDVIAEGDKVVARFTFSGTHQGEFQGIPPTGKQVTATGIDIYRIVDGKMLEHWAQIDALGMLQQLGVIPEMGSRG